MSIVLPSLFYSALWHERFFSGLTLYSHSFTLELPFRLRVARVARREASPLHG
jgi:hypothetical protein